MEKPSHERLIRLFDQAISLSPDQRDRLLHELRDEDEGLATELESLLAAHVRAPNGLDQLAGHVVPRLFDELRRSPGAVPRVPRALGRYRILERLGEGGMGEVYKALDVVLDRPVALKFIRADQSADAEARLRLIREARVVSRLDHPNIAAVYEVGVHKGAGAQTVGDQVYVAMAFCRGETLATKISRGPLSAPQAAGIAAQVADALAAAHGAGLVHRDIKPSNVIVTESGQAKLLDFGMALVAGAGSLDDLAPGGTVSRMSPEQVRGGPVDGRSDIWALGLVIHEMLTGRPPPAASGVFEISSGEGSAPGAPVHGIPGHLAGIIDRCLEPDPDHRYPSAGELRDDLRAAAEAADRESVTGDRVRRSPLRFAALTLAASAAAAIAGWAFLLLSGTLPDAPVKSSGDGSPTIAILPFVPIVDDTALQALGRGLAATLAADLHGVGDLTVLDGFTVVSATEAGQPGSRVEADRIARRLQADRAIMGTLTRAGGAIRLDLTLRSTGSDSVLARATVSESGLDQLSRVAAIELLDDLWRREPPDAPSLAALMSTRVPAARRAYLEGEIALARADMSAAVDGFERAFEADSTFWWAYWRSLYPRSYREAGAPADTALVQALFDHRAGFPEADRLLIEASFVDSRFTALERLEELVDRFPRYSPGWWAYANRLVHLGPYLNRPTERGLAALNRYLTLEPRNAAAWDHMLWVAAVHGDTALVGHAAREVIRLTRGPRANSGWLDVVKLRAKVARSPELDDEGLREAADLMLSVAPGLGEAIASGLVADGRPAAQIQLNRATRQRADAGLRTALWRGEALAWAYRGAWEEALSAADRGSRSTVGEDGELDVFRLAVAGATLGLVPVAEAARRRPGEGRAARWPEAARTDLAWLDGVLAYLERQPGGLSAARTALAAAPEQHSDVLDRSLAALEADLAGDRQRAARLLVEIERGVADQGDIIGLGKHHPTFNTTNRILASDWLRSLGHDLEAAQLLLWHEAIPGPSLLQAWNRSLGGITLLSQAEIAEAAGDTARALTLYSRFLERHDRPAPSLTPRLDKAAGALRRLSPDAAH